MLELKDVSVIFNEGTVNEKVALSDINLKLNTGDFVKIIGSNGAGKSTLFQAISGAVETKSGSILLNDRDITFEPEYKRSRVIGRLFQDPLKGTAPNMTIEENLHLSNQRGKHFSLSLMSHRYRDTFKKALKELDLGLEDRLETKVGLLSGGQRQALTLLMATLVTPELLLLDEHTAALDPKTAEKVLELSKKIVNENNITTLIIIKVPNTLIPHIVINEKIKGALVSPIPLNVPSRITKIPYIGSDTETILNTLAPISITFKSVVKIIINCFAKINKTIPQTLINTIVIPHIKYVISLTLRSLFSPIALPTNVASAA